MCVNSLCRQNFGSCLFFFFFCADLLLWKAFEAQCFDLDHKPARKIKEWKNNSKFEIRFGLENHNYAKIFHKNIVELLHGKLNLPFQKCMIYLGSRTMGVLSWEISLGKHKKLSTSFDTKKCKLLPTSWVCKSLCCFLVQKKWLFQEWYWTLFPTKWS